MMNEDWEQVTPFLQDMQHCAEEDYFNPQEVSEQTLKAQTFYKKKKKKPFITTFCVSGLLVYIHTATLLSFIVPAVLKEIIKIY